MSARPRIMTRLPVWIVTGLVLLWPPAAGIAHDVQAGAPPGSLTLVSLNLALREDVHRIVRELEAVGADRADVMLLQEVAQRGDSPDVATQLAERLELHAVYREAWRRGDGLAFGQATLARHPIDAARAIELKQFDFAFRDKDRMALAATLDTPAGRVRTYNVHLDTRINLSQRLEQIDAVVEDIRSTTDPVIVGGDFNTNNNRWLFHTIPLPFFHRQARGLERFMEAFGFQSALDGRPTHDALRMRLDWVFLKGLEAWDASVRPVEMSDHHALVVSVVRPGATQARPDFSGTWTVVASPGDEAAGTPDLTVMQTADRLVVEQMGVGRESVLIRIVYRLDGTEMPQTVNRTEIVTRAAWDGPRLVTAVTGASADWRDTWSIEADRLVIVTTTPGRALTIRRTYQKR
jgi:endonuclease/exonuclease/phosphatase family metal-dependent hydrolase